MEKDQKKENGPTNPPPPHRPPVPAKKRGGAMSLLRAAVFMVRRRSSTKKLSVNGDVVLDAGTADAVLKTLVGGMRPLHQLDFKQPPPPPPPPAADSFHDVLQPPATPTDGMSRYASAEDLQLLDTSEGDEGEVERDGSGEPNAIDMKAEEFIAMFYKQMRLQRSESFNGEVIEQGA